MSQKNYAEVLIDGVAYTLGGVEDEGYLRRVAAYLNEKIGSIKSQRGFSRQNADYQTLMIQLNIADDYFKEQERADVLSGQKASLEKEAYSLKHELITTQIRLETLQKELEAERRRHGASGAETAKPAETEKPAQPAEKKPGSGKR